MKTKRRKSAPPDTRNNYPDRYADNWPTIAKRTRRALANRCSNCWWRKSEQVHHAQYSDLFGRIAGREVAGFHVFPLCGDTSTPGTCHHQVHSGGRWKRNGELGSCNLLPTKLSLRLRYWLLWLLLLPFKALTRRAK